MAYHVELLYQVSKIKEGKVTFTFPRVTYAEKPPSKYYEDLESYYWAWPDGTVVHVYELWIQARPDDDWVKDIYERYKLIHLEELNEVFKDTVSRETKIIWNEKRA